MYVTACAGDFIKKDDCIWFVDLNLPYLCCYSEKEKCVIRKVEIPRGKSVGYAHYESIVFKDPYIIGIPYLADSFFRYNINDNQIELLNVPWLDEKYIMPYYSPAVEYNNKIYIFRKFMDFSEFETNRVIVLDPILFEINSFVINEELKFDEYGVHGSAFRNNFSINNDFLFILRWNKKMLVELNLSNKDINLYYPDENIVFETITCIDENNYYLSDKNMNIWLWNRKDKFKKIEYEVKGFSNPVIADGDKDSMGYSLLINEKIYFFPCFANMILEYDYTRNILREAEFSKFLVDNNYVINMSKHGREYVQFSRPQYIDGLIYIWNMWNKKIYKINIDSLETTSKTIFMDIDDKELYNEIVCRNKECGFIEEHNFCLDIDLYDFLKSIVKS